MMHPLIIRAMNFSWNAHRGQVRKYTGEPYFYHTQQVAYIVNDVGGSVEAICAAYLHDTIEDTETTYEDILKEFGESIANLVEQLSDVSKPEDGNRAIRKEMDRVAYIGACDDAKTVKLADLISNTESITGHDRGFALTYMKEKEMLLPYLEGGNEVLYKRCLRIIEDWKKGAK